MSTMQRLYRRPNKRPMLRSRVTGHHGPQNGVLGDLLSKRIYDALVGIQNDQRWSRTPRRIEIGIKGEKTRKPGCEKLGIRLALDG